MTRTPRREVETLLVAAGRRAVPESRRLGVAPIGRTTTVADHIVPSRRQLRTMLRAAGARPVPSLMPRFVALADPYGLVPPPAVDLEPRRRHSSRRPVLLTGAAAAALTVVVVVALTGVVGGPEAVAELQLATSVDTVVVLPDGSTVDGTRGLALPDGAVVRTGPHGRASAGGVDLGPGGQALVEDGRLVETAATEAAPVTPSSGAQDDVTVAVDDVAAAAVEDVPTTPSGGGSADPGSATEIPPPALPPPTLTAPTLTLPRLERTSLPGVGPLP